MKITATTTLHGVELGEELASAMSQAIAEEIDWQILTELMIGAGWHKIEVPTDSNSAVALWAAENIKGHYECRFDTWIFERSEDAVWFTLRWSS
jgi:hypothetical protein